MTTRKTPLVRCPHSDCPSNARGVAQHVIRHSMLKTRSGRRCRRLCRVCGRTFSATTGTPYHRMRRPKRDLDLAVRLQAEGTTKAGIGRAVGAHPSTVGRWLERTGRHARAFQDAHLRLAEGDRPHEFQFDELSCKGKGAAENAWAFNGIEVWTRLWTALRVGNRTLRNTTLFVRQLAAAVGPRMWPFLVTSDGFKYYEEVRRRVLGKTRCVYVQVENRYGRGEVVRSDYRQVLGTREALDWVMARSEDSKVPNTSFVERINLSSRMSCSFLRRRNPAPARKPEKIEQALELVRLIYNFVQPHGSLRFGSECRTPAMQAGLFSRPLTLREIFSWVVPADTHRRRRLLEGST